MVKRIVPIILIIMVIILATLYGVFNLIMLESLSIKGISLSDRTSISFRVDKSFTKVERMLILEAFTDISRVSGCIKLNVTFAPILGKELLSWRRDNRATMYKASMPFTWRYHSARYLTGKGVYMGVAMLTTGDIFIMADIEDSFIDFKNTIIHETLHVIFQSGWHSPHGESLMYPSIGGGKQKFLKKEIMALQAMCKK